MDEYNIFIIIVIIILLFFLSADKNINNDTIDTIPLLLILLILYFCINNISLGILLIAILCLVLSTTNLKQIIMERLYFYTKNEQFTSNVDKFFSVFDNSLIKNKIEEKKQKLEEEKKLNDKIYQEKVDKEHEKNKDLIINTNNHDKVKYDEFKKEMDMFNGINSSNTASNIENNSESNIENNSESNSEQNIVEQQSQSTDINNLMMKLDTDLSKLKT